MGKNSRMQKKIKEIRRKTQHFLSHEGKQFCAAMLCASLVLGNTGSIANASNVLIAGDGSPATPSNVITAATPSNAKELQKFQLTEKELYEALQDAIDRDVRADVEFTGGSTEEYEDFFLEPGDYYELKTENGTEKNKAELRIFARVEESELVSGEKDDYVVDGTEEMLFLMINRSEEDQRAAIQVDEKMTSEVIIPVNVKSEAEVKPSPVLDTTKASEAEKVATPSNGEEATPSDSTETPVNPEEKTEGQLEGEFYALTSVKEGTAVGFLTTAGELGLDDMALIATDSNALTRYSIPVDGAENILVDVTAKRGTLPEGAELRATYLTEDGNEYQDAKNALDEANEEYGGMMALDIGFWLNDEEIEPAAGSEVQVKIRMDGNLLPDDVDVGTLKVQHHAETDQGIRVETVAKAVTVETEDEAAVPMTMSLMSLNADAVPVDEEILDDVIIEEADPENPVETIMDTVNAEPGTLKVIETDGEAAVVETAFVVDGFSKFTITWNSSERLGIDATFKVTLYDTDGREISPDNVQNITVGENKTKINFADIAVNIPGYTFQYAKYNTKNVKSAEKYWQEFAIPAVKFLNNNDRAVENTTNLEDIPIGFYYQKDQVDKTIEAKVYLRYSNTIPANVNNDEEAAKFGPSGNNEPYITVTVNLEKIHEQKKPFIKTVEGQKFIYYSGANSDGSLDKTVALEFWNSYIYPNIEENDKKALDSIFGEGQFYGYVLKRESDGWHIDGVLKKDPPIYVVELYDVTKEPIEVPFVISANGIENLEESKQPGVSYSTFKTRVEAYLQGDTYSYEEAFDNVIVTYSKNGKKYKSTITPYKDDHESVYHIDPKNKLSRIKDFQYWAVTEKIYYLCRLQIETEELPSGELNIEKIVDGNAANVNQDFTFTLSSPGLKNQSYPISYSVGGKPNKIEFNDIGIAIISLKHGEHAIIQQLPIGVTVKITEDAGTNTTSTKIKYSYGNGGPTVAINNEIEVNIAANGVNVLYTNTQNIPIPTGIFDNNLPYLVMLAMAAIGLTGFGRIRRRVKKSRDDD